MKLRRKGVKAKKGTTPIDQAGYSLFNELVLPKRLRKVQIYQKRSNRIKIKGYKTLSHQLFIDSISKFV